MNGLLLIDKPEGWTSHDVVAKLRGVLRERRIGHAGTLDPMATGLLVVLIGRATRAMQFAEADDKDYEAKIRFGLVTDTLDTTGKTISDVPCEADREELERALEGFRGEIEQIPPMYSAIKMNGQKLLTLARAGREAERKPRRITVSRLEIRGGGSRDYELFITCSKGTYVRSLCHDIGQKLGCGACMSQLRRTRSGAFSLENAYSLKAVIDAATRGEGESLLIPVDRLFAKLPSIIISGNLEKKCRAGTQFQTDAADGKYRVYAESGEFLMLGQAAHGEMKTVKSFFEV